MRGACLPVTLLSGGCRVWCDPEGAAAFVAVALCLHMAVVLFVTFTIKNESAHKYRYVMMCSTVAYCAVICCACFTILCYVELCCSAL